MIRHWVIGSQQHSSPDPFWYARQNAGLLIYTGRKTAWDCEFIQKEAWQFRRFLGEYRIRAGRPPGAGLSSRGSLINCLSPPERCCCLKSQDISKCEHPRAWPEWQRDTLSLSAPAWWPCCHCLSSCFRLPLFHLAAFCKCLQLTSSQITFN